MSSQIEMLTDLLRHETFQLSPANLQKFLVRNLLEARIRDLRKQAVGKAFQQALFGDFPTLHRLRTVTAISYRRTHSDCLTSTRTMRW